MLISKYLTAELNSFSEMDILPEHWCLERGGLYES
jgi:hypothetical protein